MLKLKPFKETPGHCGPASLKIVLEYFGIIKIEKELARMCGLTKAGTKTKNMLKTAKKFGLKGFIKDFSDIKDIKKWVIDKKIPVIVDWFLEDDGHASVVVDIDSKNIYLLDPRIGKIRKLNLKIFKRIWFDFPGDFIKSKNQLILRRMMVVYRW